ncbi:hypothetical protein HQ489_04385 [Candidatus Woesearchaeota archaeon]|nr:hypothetical protein [Candidatus Woesearchaeota archaeon]
MVNNNRFEDELKTHTSQRHFGKSLDLATTLIGGEDLGRSLSTFVRSEAERLGTSLGDYLLGNINILYAQDIPETYEAGVSLDDAPLTTTSPKHSYFTIDNSAASMIHLGTHPGTSNEPLTLDSILNEFYRPVLVVPVESNGDPQGYESMHYFFDQINKVLTPNGLLIAHNRDDSNFRDVKESLGLFSFLGNWEEYLKERKQMKGGILDGHMPAFREIENDDVCDNCEPPENPEYQCVFSDNFRIMYKPIETISLGHSLSVEESYFSELSQDNLFGDSDRKGYHHLNGTTPKDFIEKVLSARYSIEWNLNQ